MNLQGKWKAIEKSKLYTGPLRKDVRMNINMWILPHAWCNIWSYDIQCVNGIRAHRSVLWQQQLTVSTPLSTTDLNLKVWREAFSAMEEADGGRGWTELLTERRTDVSDHREEKRSQVKQSNSPHVKPQHRVTVREKHILDLKWPFCRISNALISPLIPNVVSQLRYDVLAL